jgi:hypothetical protein
MSDTMTTRDPDVPEARLFDIVVEEVSLVDQAANKRQFLIIKRARDTMTKSAAGVSKTDAVEGGGGASDTAGGVSDATLDALERVAKAIGDVADEIDEPSDIARLVAIAEQLNALVESVLEDADDDEAEEEADTGKAATTSASAPTAGADQGDGRSKFEAMFAKIEGALASLHTKANLSTPVTPPTPPDSGTGLTADTDPLAKVLAAISGLSADIKAQGQRLGRLEKGVGLPSSQATTERAPRAREAEVSWPLDLNAPVARGSVDKTVSFHDD